jgi:hypothetical protein
MYRKVTLDPLVELPEEPEPTEAEATEAENPLLA